MFMPRSWVVVPALIFWRWKFDRESSVCRYEIYQFSSLYHPALRTAGLPDADSLLPSIRCQLLNTTILTMTTIHSQHSWYWLSSRYSEYQDTHTAWLWPLSVLHRSMHKLSQGWKSENEKKTRGRNFFGFSLRERTSGPSVRSSWESEWISGGDWVPLSTNFYWAPRSTEFYSELYSAPLSTVSPSSFYCSTVSDWAPLSLPRHQGDWAAHYPFSHSHPLVPCAILTHSLPGTLTTSKEGRSWNRDTDLEIPL